MSGPLSVCNTKLGGSRRGDPLIAIFDDFQNRLHRSLDSIGCQDPSTTEAIKTVCAIKIVRWWEVAPLSHDVGGGEELR